MAEKTKQELEQELEQLRGQMKSLQAQNEGWLITTPNPAYDGKMYGIQFINGQAFIPKDREIPHFMVKPLKDTQTAGMKAEDIAAIREREKIPSSERLANALRDDFGYTVDYYSADDTNRLRQEMDKRADERRQTEAALEAARKQAELVQPQYFNK